MLDGIRTAHLWVDINSINMWIPLTECGGEAGAPDRQICGIKKDSKYREDPALMGVFFMRLLDQPVA